MSLLRLCEHSVAVCNDFFLLVVLLCLTQGNPHPFEGISETVKKAWCYLQLQFFAFLCLLVKSLRWKQTSSITTMFLAENRGSLAPPLRTLGLTLGEICVFIKKVNISWLSACTLLSRDMTYLARFGNCFRYHFLRYCRQ